jgi:hypothetical protein
MVECYRLASYKANYDLSWFRPLLEDNSPTSNGYNGVSRELKKFTW